MRYAIFIALALLVVACEPQAKTLIDTVPRTEQELIYTDVFDGNFSSKEVSVLGIRVGMSEEEVRTKLGDPDHQTEFDFGAIKNWEYSTKLNLNETGVLYHMEQGVVTRITVFPAMNEYLVGNGTIGKEKELVYAVYGIPERQYDIPGGRFFVYNAEGFEVYLNRHGEYQYAFVYPMRKMPSMAYEAKNITQAEILKIPLPKPLIDTTTMCDQGPTFGMNPASGDCAAFTDACSIPDHYVEVFDCTNKERVAW